MKQSIRLSAACAIGLLAIAQNSIASPGPRAGMVVGGGISLLEMGAPFPKAASTRTLGSRATATPSATVYGGFELAAQATVYILVRGNSLGTLGVTQAFLDAPRVRIYNAQGADLIFDQGGRGGFNYCLASQASQLPVRNYYAQVRGQPASEFDGCFAGTFPAGGYSFTVTPSIAGVTTGTENSVPSSGEILFEITLGP
jgi:hypothetical protein